MFSRLTLPIGVKIFGVASSMLALLLGVTYLSTTRIRQVNGELIDIAEYLTPLTESVALVNVHVLEQEIHLQRIFKIYEIEPLDQAKLQQELAAFEDRGQLVDEELEAAIALAQESVNNSHRLAGVIELTRVEALLEVLEEEHQKFHDQGLVVIELFAAGDTAAAELLNTQLADYEEDFDQRAQRLLRELAEFTEASALIAEKHERQTIRLSWILVGSATVLGIAFASLVTTSLVRPVRRLVASTREVEQGNLDLALPIASQDEIGKLTHSFNDMVQEIREKERLKATFGQYVDPRVVETLVEQQHQAEHGSKQMMTVFLSDIAGFTSISEMLTPTGLVTLINQYLTLASAPITEHGGVINQFLGDAVSAFWGPPFVSDRDHAKLACYAALEQSSQLTKLRRMLPEIMGIRKGLPDLQIRIGLASGELVAGNIGSERSKSYTIVGPTVQWAERMEEANRNYGTQILITDATQQLVSDFFETRRIDRLTLNHGGEVVWVYELLGAVGELSADRLELRDRFEAALSTFDEQRWCDAEAEFKACLNINPHDGASKYYLQKLQQRVVMIES
ncbi:MAG: adenylate/guanylate cyclase domain-containing protein [Cyanobacteria bacterium P01_A01_bin.123]